MGRHDQKLDRVGISHRTRQYLGTRTTSVCRFVGGLDGSAGPGHQGTHSLLEQHSITYRRKGLTVGDRVQIAGHRGVVLAHNVFAMKLLEIRPGQPAHLYTDLVTISLNNLLFSHPLVKENPNQEYGLYTLAVPIKADNN